MSGWLDAAVVTGVIGGDLAGDVDTASLERFAGAVASWLEDRRPDVFVPPGPRQHFIVAAAMLAYETYRNRTTPDQEIGDSPELAGMLGIGKQRGLRFGGAAPLDGVTA